MWKAPSALNWNFSFPCKQRVPVFLRYFGDSSLLLSPPSLPIINLPFIIPRRSKQPPCCPHLHEVQTNLGRTICPSSNNTSSHFSFPTPFHHSAFLQCSFRNPASLRHPGYLPLLFYP